MNVPLIGGPRSVLSSNGRHLRGPVRYDLRSVDVFFVSGACAALLRRFWHFPSLIWLPESVAIGLQSMPYMQGHNWTRGGKFDVFALFSADSHMLLVPNPCGSCQTSKRSV